MPSNTPVIVKYAYHPKRARKRKAQATAITGPVIVTAKKRGTRTWRDLPPAADDPAEAERIKAFFARNVRPGGPLPPDRSE
jgi:hypothetical protein